MRRVLRQLWTFAFVAAAAGVAVLALAALFGFATALLDALNHLQPLFLTLALGLLVLAPATLRPGRGRALALSLVGMALCASAVVVVPELISRVARTLPAEPDDRPVYRLLTHNLFGKNYDMATVAAGVLTTAPDIVLLQEYFVAQSSQLDTLLRPSYPYVLRCEGGRRASLAIYARLPFEIVGDDSCALAENGDGRAARLVARFAPEGATPFTIVTSHLDWPVQVSPLWRNAGGPVERLQAMTARQEGQFADLGNALTQMPGPLLLAGDFNATPWSHQLAEFVARAGFDRVTRSLPTYPALFFVAGAWRETPPFLPLDHVMMRGGLEAHALSAGAAAGSDHLPLLVTFSVPEIDSAIATRSLIRLANR